MTNIFLNKSDILEISDQPIDDDLCMVLIKLNDYAISKFDKVANRFNYALPVENETNKCTHYLYKNSEIIGRDNNIFIIKHYMYNYAKVNITDYRKKKINTFLKDHK